MPALAFCEIKYLLVQNNTTIPGPLLLIPGSWAGGTEANLRSTSLIQSQAASTPVLKQSRRPPCTVSKSFLAYWLMPLFCALTSQVMVFGDMSVTLVSFELAVFQCELRMCEKVSMRASGGEVQRG